MGVGFALGMLGRREEALEIVGKIQLRQQQEPDLVMDADLAAVWWSLGEVDKAFYHLNQCAEKKMGPPTYFVQYPSFRPIMKDPRYAELKRRIGQ